MFVELAKKQQDAERGAMKKLDRFELTKVDIVQLIDEVKNVSMSCFFDEFRTLIFFCIS